MHERAAVGNGWDYGKERAKATEHLTLSANLVDFVRQIGRAQDPHARQLLGEIWVLDALMTLTPQRVAAGMASGALPGYAAAILKLMTGKVGARRTALLSELAGPLGVATALAGDVPHAVREAGLERVTHHNIGGGTGEMQANTVAERLLGLPREPSPDRELPFNQLRHNTVPATRGLSYRIVRPPSTLMTWPLIHTPSSDSRKATAAAMSSGSPRRGYGRLFSAFVWKSSLMPRRLVSVRTKPGAMALARTPSLPHREATCRLRASRPLLATA